MKKLQIILFCLFAFSAINLNAQTQGAGYALDFDRSNTDYVSIPDASELDLSTELTIETWIKVGNNFMSWSAIVGKGTAYAFQLTSGSSGNFRIKFMTQYSGWNNINCPTDIPLNTWQHVAVTFDGVAFRFYVNGKSVYTQNSAENFPNNSSNLVVGCDFPGGDEYIDAEIDELRIWNRPLTQTEIRNNMCRTEISNKTGLVLYLDMEGDAGNTVTDKSGNGNHGTKH